MRRMINRNAAIAWRDTMAVRRPRRGQRRSVPECVRVDRIAFRRRLRPSCAMWARMESLAKALRRDKTRVRHVSPGRIATPKAMSIPGSCRAMRVDAGTRASPWRHARRRARLGTIVLQEVRVLTRPLP